MPDNNLNSPVLLYQWDVNPASNELNFIDNELKSRAKNANLVIPDKISYLYDGDSKGYLERLDSSVASFYNLQVIYLSAHGFDKGIFGNQKDCSDFVDYCQLAGILNKLQTKYEIVMGWCHATSDLAIQNFASLLKQAFWIWGFKEEPSGNQVASLITDRLLATMKLYSSLENPSKAYSEALTRGEKVKYENFARQPIDTYDNEAKYYLNENKDSGLRAFRCHTEL
jgi:hypothetical protein